MTRSDLTQYLGSIERELEAQKKAHVKRVCRAITARLKTLKQHLPGFAFCDGMGTTVMWATTYAGRYKIHDPIVLAFEHVMYVWDDGVQPALTHSDDDIPEKALAAKIVEHHGRTIHEVLTLTRFMYEHLNMEYGDFR